MNDCVRADIRDLLPDLIHNNLSSAERSTVEEHVSSCGDCAAELDLLRGMRRSLERVTPVNVARISGGVLEAITPAPVQFEVKRRRQRSMWLAAAAVTIIAAGTLALALARSGTGHSTGPAPAVAGALPDSLRTPAIEQPANTPDVALTHDSVPPMRGRDAETSAPGTFRGELVFGGGVDDLADREIELLLEDLERVTGTLDTDPQPDVPAFGDAVSGGTRS